MKKLIVSLLALSALAGGSLSASAAAAGVTYQSYFVDVSWTNLEYWTVSGSISSPGGSTTFPVIINNTFVATDGSGKIAGGGEMDLSYNTNGFPFSRLFIDASGKISSTTAKPTAAVTLQIKGNGFTIQDHTTAQTSTPLSCNLKFTGQVQGDSNIVGTVSGTITGNTPLGTKTAKLSNVPTVLVSTKHSPSLFADVLQSSKGQMTLWASAGAGGLVTGTGNVKQGTTYTANLKGIEQAKGSSITLTGSMGTYTNGVSGTNTGISYTAPTSATISKGSISGQAVAGTGQIISTSLIH